MSGDAGTIEVICPQGIFRFRWPLPGVPVGDGGEIQRVVAPFVDDLDAAAETADDPDTEAALRTLAALGRGESVPRSARRQLRDWLGGR